MKEQAERQEREAKKKKRETHSANNAVDAAVMVAAQQLQQQQQQLKLIQQDQIRQHQQYIQQIQRQQSFMPSSNNRTFNQAQMRGYQNSFNNVPRQPARFRGQVAPQQANMPNLQNNQIGKQINMSSFYMRQPQYRPK